MIVLMVRIRIAVERHRKNNALMVTLLLLRCVYFFLKENTREKMQNKMNFSTAARAAYDLSIFVHLQRLVDALGMHIHGPLLRHTSGCPKPS